MQQSKLPRQQQAAEAAASGRCSSKRQRQQQATSRRMEIVSSDVRAVELILDNFKSFGRKTEIPFGDGFTTISGPNGSGKSNILDSILFVLGLTSSKTLRAERLPDLINNLQKEKGQAGVTLKLKVDGANEGEAQRTLEIKRMVRVGKENYSSTYYLDGRVHSLSKIHEELSKLNISPRGNNIILQGDVTRITTMSPLERRRIIDDLAGVAEFDTRIEAARQEMEQATRHMEDLNIVADEIAVRLRDLEQEKDRALEYGKLRDEKNHLEASVLVAERNDLLRRLKSNDKEMARLDEEVSKTKAQFPKVALRLDEAKERLEEVESEIRAKGEEEKLDKLRILEETKGEISRHEESIANLRRQRGDIDRNDDARQGDQEQAERAIEEIKSNSQRDERAAKDKEAAIEKKQQELKELYSRLEELNVEHSGKAEELTNLRSRLAELKLDFERKRVARDAQGKQ